MTFSKDIRLISSKFIPSQNATKLSHTLTKVMRLYARGGFVVHLVLMDMEFECIRNDFEKVAINNTTAREHVGEIER